MWKLSIVNGSWADGELRLDQKSILSFARAPTGLEVSNENRTDMCTMYISHQLYVCGSVRASLLFSFEPSPLHAAVG